MGSHSASSRHLFSTCLAPGCQLGQSWATAIMAAMAALTLKPCLSPCCCSSGGRKRTAKQRGSKRSSKRRRAGKAGEDDDDWQGERTAAV